MKKILLSACFFFSVCILQAQDTLYPLEYSGIYYMDTSKIHDYDTVGYGGTIHGANGYNNLSVFRYTGQATISGIALNILFRIYPEFEDSWNHLYGALVTIDSNDYYHPTIHLTNSYVVHDDPYNYHIALHTNSKCGTMDTVVDAYALYFDEPISVSGTFYVGFYIKKYHCRFAAAHEMYSALSCTVDFPTIYDSSLLSYNMDDDFTVRNFYPYFYPYSIAGGMHLYCPILSLPDTDTFSCPEVEEFGFAGMMAGSPTFAWDTAAEHGLYQLAYGPYDAPLDSLQVVETDNYFMELTDPSLSRDVYYQARLRAKCHHRCPIHDTVMWTAWTDPVYFYTGDNMPDTTHHHGEPEGIAEVNGQVHFALAPNPAHGSVTLTLEGMPAHGTVLTIHDGAGREVLRRVLHERVTRIDTKGLSAGVYTVTVSNPQGMGTHRLSVE